MQKPLITPDLLVEGIGCPVKVADWWDDHLNEAMYRFRIDNRNRVAAFVAQVAHESGRFHFVREIWGPTPAQRRYEGRRDLGNLHTGDGKRFMGRGPIQITGRANYRAFTKAIRTLIPDAPDFEAQPALLELPRWGALAAGWFWDAHDLNGLADNQQITLITRVINGGTNGLEERKRYWRQMLAVL